MNVIPVEVARMGISSVYVPENSGVEADRELGDFILLLVECKDDATLAEIFNRVTESSSPSAWYIKHQGSYVKLTDKVHEHKWMREDTLQPLFLMPKIGTSAACQFLRKCKDCIYKRQGKCEGE